MLTVFNVLDLTWVLDELFEFDEDKYVELYSLLFIFT